MSNELSGRRIAFLVANSGVEQVELTSPWKAIRDCGGEAALIAPERDSVQAMHGDADKGDTFEADRAVADVSVSEFDALVLPGGVANPDKLRLVPAAVALVRSFAAAGKPIAAICHAPWILVEADTVRGKQLASWPSLQTDIRNAGGHWLDEQVVVCDRAGYRLVTSRNPADLDAFNAATIAALAAIEPGPMNWTVGALAAAGEQRSVNGLHHSLDGYLGTMTMPPGPEPTPIPPNPEPPAPDPSRQPSPETEPIVPDRPPPTPYDPPAGQ
jgi:protease I